MTGHLGGSIAAHVAPEGRSHQRGRRWTSLLLGLCCLLVYNANGRAISAGDTYPARYLPFAIWQHQTVFLDPIATVTNQGRGETAFWMVNLPDGALISLYPVVLPVLLAPLYLPAVAYVQLRGPSDARLDYVARVMEKLCASLIAALSAALLYRILRRRAPGSTALLLTLAFAFGTTTWVISSQALWQHGMAQLLLIAALLLVTAPATAPRALAVGLLCGLIAGNRPPDVVLAAALGAYALFWAGPRRAALLAGAAALPIGMVLAYNLGVAGNVAGAYGLAGSASFFDYDLLSGIGGLLFSPTRGLFVFSPFLLFVVLVGRHPPRDRGERNLTMALGIAVIVQILLYAKTDWRGGYAWGPRFMTDLLPILSWMLVPVVAALRGVGRACFVLTVVAAVVIQAIGAFCYTGSNEPAIFASDGGPDEMRAAWNWRNAPFVASLKDGLAPPELTINVRGQLDTIEANGRPTSLIEAGVETVATGWALAGDSTPWQVAVVIDGRKTITTRTFFDRPDVRDGLNTKSPAGWRIPLDTSGLAPGEHRLTAVAWAAERGDIRFLEERKLTVRARADATNGAPLGDGAGPAAANGEPSANAQLEASFREAARRLREHQQAEGYWLTAHTTGTRFHEPRPEMNTYLTALLLELVSPLARRHGMEDILQRARQHLTGQIESGGLVRYHGLPDGPGMGILGCAITPDTDDTALVWRLAPGRDRGRLAAALATIDRYRTEDGLYRTWLAPREAYQCLDPGRDPNPADIAIQMHLLLLLSEVRPPAGRALCEALRPVVDDDRVWVYYRKAPLVPILRMADLRRAGCELELPESRMRTEVPGQRIWLSVARLLERTPIGGIASADATRVREILHSLADDDFALLRTDPPLLYHNDLTATVSRYYWSEDVGYALWLRLHEEYERHRHPDLGG